MGCDMSIDKPPNAVRPKQRFKQSNVMILSEMSNLSEKDVKETKTVTFKGRQATSSNFIIGSAEKEKMVNNRRIEQKMKDKELKRKQEELLRKNLQARQIQFNLKHEEETRFKEEQERIQNEVMKNKGLTDRTTIPNSVPIADDEETKDAFVEERSSLNNKVTPSRLTQNDSIGSEPLSTSIIEVDEAPLPSDKRFLRASKFNLSGVTKTGWDFPDVKPDGVPYMPDPKPPTYRKKDIVPNVNEFAIFDKHAITAPPATKTSISMLVNYLKDFAENKFQLVRMFYRWITFNISFDVEGFYEESEVKSTEPVDVLQSGITISEGYANMMEAMCRFAGIPAKIIQGYVKGYDFKVGDIVNLTDSHTAHTWNAVYINENWFFIDCTWGAGYIDAKKEWVRHFEEFYFIIDPDKMIVDHFPYIDRNLKTSAKWQLLVSPISVNSFSQRKFNHGRPRLMDRAAKSPTKVTKKLKLEKAALEWDVKPVTHTQHHIITVRREVEIRMEEVDAILEDYTVQFQRKDGSRNLEAHVLAYKIDERTLKIKIRPPQEIDYILNIFAKKSLDTKGNPELLVTYILKVIEVIPVLRPYPLNYRLYGAVPHYRQYGFGPDITKCVEYTTNSGEMVLPFNTKRSIKCMTKLEHVTNKDDLTNYCLVTTKPKAVSLKIRFPLEGYYKFTIFGKSKDGGNFRPVATFLIDCNQTSHVHSGFPVAFEAAMDLHCTLYKPLWKDLPANSLITIVLGCQKLACVKVLFESLRKDDDIFEGTVRTPPAGQPFTIYGQTSSNGALVGLYHFTIF